MGMDDSTAVVIPESPKPVIHGRRGQQTLSWTLSELQTVIKIRDENPNVDSCDVGNGKRMANLKKFNPNKKAEPLPLTRSRRTTDPPRPVLPDIKKGTQHPTEIQIITFVGGKLFAHLVKSFELGEFMRTQAYTGRTIASTFLNNNFTCNTGNWIALLDADALVADVIQRNSKPAATATAGMAAATTAGMVAAATAGTAAAVTAGTATAATEVENNPVVRFYSTVQSCLDSIIAFLVTL